MKRISSKPLRMCPQSRYIRSRVQLSTSKGIVQKSLFVEWILYVSQLCVMVVRGLAMLSARLYVWQYLSVGWSALWSRLKSFNISKMDGIPSNFHQALMVPRG